MFAGAVFSEKSLVYNEFGEECTMMIWDTSGSEEFDDMTTKYYKGASAVVLMYSLTDARSFDDVPSWLRRIDKLCGRRTPVSATLFCVTLV